MGRLIGGTGDDRITVLSGSPTLSIDGGSGDDVIYVNTLTGGGFVDGGSGTDTLSFGVLVNLSALTLLGLDILTGWRDGFEGFAHQFEAFDTIRTDDVVYSGPVILRLLPTGAPTILDLRDELAASGQAVEITGSSDDERIVGGSRNDVLDGAEGDDTLNGDAGSDRLIGGPGADRMFGGAGNDTYLVNNGGDVVSDLGAAGIWLCLLSAGRCTRTWRVSFSSGNTP